MRKRQVSKAPIGLQAAFGHVGNHPGRTPDLRVQDQPGGKRDFGQRAATGEEGVSAPILPGRTGFRPGSCETGGPRTSVHGRQAEPEASAEDPAINGTRASAEGPRWGEEGREFRTAERRTARASALVGEPAGKPAPASAGKGPRRKRYREPPVLAPSLETARCGTPCLPGQVPAKGQWGPAATPAPITVWGAAAVARHEPAHRSTRVFAGLTPHSG